MSPAGKLLAGLRARRPWQAELYARREARREIAWAEGKPKDTVSERSEGMALRVMRGGRQGFAFGREISSATGKLLWDRARELMPCVPSDRFRRLPSPAAVRNGWVPPPASPMFRQDVKELQERLAESERRLLRADRRIKKVLDLSVEESESAWAVASTEGVAFEQKASVVSLSLELMGESRGEVQVAWDFSAALDWADLDGDAVLNGARDRLLGSFGARPLKSGNWPVIFSPKVAVEFLDVWGEAVCADAVQDGRSFLAERLGERVASDVVSLVDDGRYPGGLASAAFDDEGQPTRRTVVVERGRLRKFLYDSYAARKEGRVDGGNAMRDGVSGPPAPDTTNFYLEPGSSTPAELFGGTKKAFWLWEVMGLHTADPVSGDFSVGASGALLEKGRPVRAVKGVTLAGNFLDLFRRVDGVANDLTWYGSTGAPTFRVSDLAVGGE